MTKKLFQVDAFTSEAFKGNPAGVLLSDTHLDESFMQQMAAEMNLSETAFVTPGDDCFNIRFFTPYAEIMLCGHATLAAAAVLYDQRMVAEGDPIFFKSSHHHLYVMGDRHHLKMDFPILGVSSVPVTEDFTDTTGLMPDALYRSEHGWYLAWMKGVEDVHRAHPRIQHMRHSEYGHLIVASRPQQREGYDCFVRVFVPALGIDEDPVTGSAQCVIAPVMKERHGLDYYTVLQDSSRSGTMSVRCVNDERIEIEGSAVIIFEGVVRV
ncbi:PhzF family phenazine biosynthesis protein [Breznakibacter xylanolyticus]|uniref:PhzF family phenazine biosynthesis protein n=1 Tax=Breznakibacter xylanolyticus TaxID=990 RepID=A0A2W7MWK8_9BACT|nr:PhzF family phenazine biosynthesis protein [Breznakibacter xylanolyticus]MBN2743887.1 PhzF family phenazine biosynthesis protein [Marinilabiliaceae bacterium]PZX12338.1 PhzF family phenazine biosynthesis protein [Breznakibacter xylanolyticus]